MCLFNSKTATWEPSLLALFSKKKKKGRGKIISLGLNRHYLLTGNRVRKNSRFLLEAKEMDDKSCVCKFWSKTKAFTDDHRHRSFSYRFHLSQVFDFWLRVFYSRDKLSESYGINANSSHRVKIGILNSCQCLRRPRLGEISRILTNKLTNKFYAFWTFA